MEQKSVLDLIVDIKELNEDIIEVEFLGQKIKVKGYIPIEEKYQLVNWVIAQNRRNQDTQLLNRIDIDKKLDVAIVNFYTDYEFDIINKDVFNKTYDILNTENFFNIVINSIPKEEYEYITAILNKEIENDDKYHCTIAGALNTLLEKFNEGMAGTKEALEQIATFDINKYQEVANIAEKMGKPVLAYEKKENK